MTHVKTQWDENVIGLIFTSLRAMKLRFIRWLRERYISCVWLLLYGKSWNEDLMVGAGGWWLTGWFDLQLGELLVHSQWWSPTSSLPPNGLLRLIWQLGFRRNHQSFSIGSVRWNAYKNNIARNFDTDWPICARIAGSNSVYLGEWLSSNILVQAVRVSPSCFPLYCSIAS